MNEWVIRRTNPAGLRMWSGMRNWSKWLWVRLQPQARKLRLEETLPLGDKRFVAVVTWEGVRFLIGGGTGSVSLLTTLPPAVSFSDRLTQLQVEAQAK